MMDMMAQRQMNHTRLNDHLTDEQVKNLKNILLGEKERILNKCSDTTTFKLDTNELSDPVDEASVNLQTSQELRFRTREGILLKKINKALEKVERGVYGLCNECDCEIRYERLEARPVAELCILCKEESEMTEKSNFYQKRSKSLGKTIQEM
jgi:DnaK suppressor protein